MYTNFQVIKSFSNSVIIKLFRFSVLAITSICSSDQQKLFNWYIIYIIYIIYIYIYIYMYSITASWNFQFSTIVAQLCQFFKKQFIFTRLFTTTLNFFENKTISAKYLYITKCTKNCSLRLTLQLLQLG